ncbi:unnamed protein product [Diamesa serratosioi]
MSIGNGEPIRLITIKEDHSYELNEDLLKNVLLNDDVKDRNVVIVSVAGAMKRGKSFILDFFLRYLSAQYVRKDVSNWLGDKNAPLQGFSWEGGLNSTTSGIFIWSEIFLHTTKLGEKVAIILMDTQGVFDNESTTRDNTFIFALSSMLSSVQIYNLQGNIQEDDLQHLQLFTEYGKAALEETGEKPFQNIMFLVRDWQFPNDAPYGAEGGQMLLDKKLKISDDSPEELQSLRIHIKSCFEKTSAYLMPHPGFGLEEQDFSGKLTELRPAFIKQLEVLVPHILAPENLVQKTKNGRKMLVKEMLNAFVSYIMIFNSDALPTPMGLLEAISKANNLAAETMAIEYYSYKLQTISDKKINNIEAFDQLHYEYKSQAVEKFNAEARVGGERRAVDYRNNLLDKIMRVYKETRVAALAQINSQGYVAPNITDSINEYVDNVVEVPRRFLHTVAASLFGAPNKSRATIMANEQSIGNSSNPSLEVEQAANLVQSVDQIIPALVNTVLGMFKK